MSFLELEFVTPEIRQVFKVKYVSLEDKLGSLSIYPGHDRFITVLTRSVGHFLGENGEEFFFAYDYGFLKAERDRVSLLSRVVIIGGSLRELREKLKAIAEKIDVRERDFRRSVENLERMILKRMVEMEKP